MIIPQVMYSIELSEIVKSYSNTTALSGISFNVEQGEIFGLIGPDGAGKTSLFRIIVSLLLPDSGSVKVCGLDAVKEYRSLRSRLGYMPGRFSLYPDLSVQENLEFYAHVFGSNIEENYELIRDIYSQIEPFRKRKARDLSGGMKQKLALSCALIHRPELLVLDEPTTGVDAVSRTEFWELLQKIRMEGISILVSTPYMDEAMLCDRIGLIQGGRLLAVDKPGNVKRMFRSVLYSLVSLHSNFLILNRIRSLEGIDSAWLAGQSIHLSILPGPHKESVLHEIQKLEPGCILEPIEPGIEDTFIELMQIRE